MAWHMSHIAYTLGLSTARLLACVMLTAGATADVTQETSLHTHSGSIDTKGQHNHFILTLPEIGMEIPRAHFKTPF
jgi:hypothetical protein